jgi:AhpD family alkylhydroperoxidase
MDAKTQVLIGIGAAVAAKCQKCFGFILKKAQKIGVDEKEINAAVYIAKQVIKGANNSMDKFVASHLHNNEKFSLSELNKECECIEK